MSIYFNANEIFQIGVQIETNGKLFYETAAKQSQEEAAKKLFIELAFWENQHIDLFETLRLQLLKLPKREISSILIQTFKCTSRQLQTAMCSLKIKTSLGLFQR